MSTKNLESVDVENMKRSNAPLVYISTPPPNEPIYEHCNLKAIDAFSISLKQELDDFPKNWETGVTGDHRVETHI